MRARKHTHKKNFTPIDHDTIDNKHEVANNFEALCGHCC